MANEIDQLICTVLRLRIRALAERSIYVENILRHAFIAELSYLVWRQDPFDFLKVSNAEVDDSGYDVVLTRGTTARYIQLKQCHGEKVPQKFSVRVSFASLPGSCVVVISHSLLDLRPISYSFYGSRPDDPMPPIMAYRATKSPGRREPTGKRIVRVNYRDVPYSQFKRKLSAEQLLDELFPDVNA